MNEIILLFLGMVGIFAIAGSVALIALGKMIDCFPTEGEENRVRSIASPAESTILAVVLFWILFFPGAWAILQTSTVTLIVGITILFSICLFMFTALIFSFAVLATMKQRSKKLGEIERQADIDAALIHLEKTTGVRASLQVESTEKRRKPVHSSLISTIFKNF
jgi:hypothetical protein